MNFEPGQEVWWQPNTIPIMDWTGKRPIQYRAIFLSHIEREPEMSWIKLKNPPKHEPDTRKVLTTQLHKITFV